MWQSTLAEPCDIDVNGSCDVQDLTSSSLFHVNLVEGSDRESDVLHYDISGDGVDVSAALWQGAVSSIGPVYSKYIVSAISSPPTNGER